MYLHIIELVIFIGGTLLTATLYLLIDNRVSQKVSVLIENETYSEEEYPELGRYALLIAVIGASLLAIPYLKLCYFIYSLLYSSQLRSPYYCSIFNWAHFVLLYTPLFFVVVHYITRLIGVIVFRKDWLRLFVLISVYDFEYKTNKIDYRKCKEKKERALHSSNSRLVWSLLVFYIFIAVCCIIYISGKSENFVLMSTEIQFGYKSYDYSDVAEIYLAEKTVAPIGKIIEEDHVIIVFDDGRIWSDLNHKAMSDAAVRFLEIKSGVEAVEVEYAPDL